MLLEETVWPQSNTQWFGIIGLGVGPVGLAFFAWGYAIKNGNIQVLAVMAYAAPLISVLLDVPVFNYCFSKTQQNKAPEKSQLSTCTDFTGVDINASPLVFYG